MYVYYARRPTEAAKKFFTYYREKKKYFYNSVVEVKHIKEMWEMGKGNC
jgi:hypothetical protein